MPICGIYKITNQINGKCYIGQSVNIEKRWKQHCQQAFSVNSICYDSYFYRSIRKYGLENFIFEILEECLKEQLNDKQSSYEQIKKRLSSFGEQRAKLENLLKEKREKLTETTNYLMNPNTYIDEKLKAEDEKKLEELNKSKEELNHRKEVNKRRD